MTDIETKDNSKNSVSSIKHDSTYDTDVINKAVEKGSRDPNFLSHAASLLAKMQFPAFKNNILEYIKKVTTDTNVIALFESLDGYINSGMYIMYKKRLKKITQRRNKHIK